MKQENRKLVCYFVFHITIPLVLGVIIYCIFRPDTYIAVWVRKIAGNNVPGKFDIRRKNSNWLTIFAKNYACDILWAYALTAAVYFVEKETKRGGFKCIAWCWLFEIFMELLQYFGVTQGTFDIWDIVSEMTATATAAAVLQTYGMCVCGKKRNGKEKGESGYEK